MRCDRRKLVTFVTKPISDITKNESLSAKSANSSGLVLKYDKVWSG